ncbi:MAG: tetratricopeptide repeat protein [Rhodocyclaceae bacterium]|nr:tetratricopeptide repeat protein [Rhodocyclaceae bacterium]
MVSAELQRIAAAGAACLALGMGAGFARAEAPASATAEAGTSGDPPRVRSKRQARQADPDLLRAWRAYGEGQLTAARAAYAAVLARDAHNVQAWNGLALVALRAGEHALALECYRRAAAADPKDAQAQAALALMEPRPAPDSLLRLKQQLAEQPRAAALHFALGALYADQAQWSEAQSAFFAAAGLDAGNPDYLYNLAVSLDQLRQSAPALRHYRAALAAARSRPAAFDIDKAQRRAAQLATDPEQP